MVENETKVTAAVVHNPVRMYHAADLCGRWPVRLYATLHHRCPACRGYAHKDRERSHNERNRWTCKCGHRFKTK